jgi:hypothetical protein
MLYKLNRRQNKCYNIYLLVKETWTVYKTVNCTIEGEPWRLKGYREKYTLGEARWRKNS